MFESSVCGIPCQIKVETLTIVKPWGAFSNPQDCPSADDYYGYSEVEFSVYDRKGYRAKWLESKLTGDDIERIEIEAVERGEED